MLAILYSALVFAVTNYAIGTSSANSIRKGGPQDTTNASGVNAIFSQKNTEIGLKFLKLISEIGEKPAFLSTNSSLYGVKNPSDIIFSPVGLLKTLYMLAMGSKAATELELAKLIFEEPPPDATSNFYLKYHQCFKKIQDSVSKTPAAKKKLKSEAYGPDSSPNLLIWVTKVYLDQRFKVNPTFEKNLRQYYDTEVETLNFEENGGASARDLINSWVSDKTQGKITKALHPPVPDSLSRLIILNVLYFRAMWEIPFKKELTVGNETFFAAQDKVIITVPMMRNPHINLKINYIEDINAEYVELPFVTKKVSMYVVLPLENEGLPYLLQNLGAKHIETMTRPGETLLIDLKLPKLTITTNLDVKAYFRKLGLRTIFDSRSADFSGISNTSDLFVSEFRQSAAIELHEEGAEAAAITSVVISERSGPYEFIANHPFFYFLFDNEAKVILFAGTVWDPSTTNVAIGDEGKASLDPLTEPRKIVNERVKEVIKAINERLEKISVPTSIIPLPSKDKDDGGRSSTFEGRIPTDAADIINPYFIPYLDPAVLKQLTDLMANIKANFSGSVNSPGTKAAGF